MSWSDTKVIKTLAAKLWLLPDMRAYARSP
jgi:hypothetical protein